MPSDSFGQYAQDSGGMADPLGQQVRIKSQYTASQPTITQGDFSYRNPQHPYAHALRRPAVSFAGGFQQQGGAGGMTTVHQRQRQVGLDGEREWRQSQARVDRLKEQQQGQRAWEASPDDYNAVIAPDRSGGMGPVTMGPRQIGLHPDGKGDIGWGGASVPARRTNGNGNGNGGLSGGAAQTIPSGVGGDW
jgi:hypothetical protein